MTIQKAFILGNPRSGTSLLRIMLNTHPAISAAPESGFLQWWHQKYNSWSTTHATDVQSVREFVKDLLSSKKIETWKLNDEELVSYLVTKAPINYGELGLAVYEFWATRSGKQPKVIIDKNNYYIDYLDSLKNIWSDAKYIHIIRDGRDVACSYITLKGLKSNSKYRPDLKTGIEEIAKEWKENNEKILHFMQLQPKSNSVTIRYEDLIAQPAATVQKVIDLFALRYNEEMLNFYKQNDEPVETADWKRKTFESIDPGNSMKYKKLLSKAQIDEFNGCAHDLLKKYSYE